MTKVSSEGDRIVIVKMIVGDNVLSDIVVNGKPPLLGVATSNEVLELASRALAENRIIETVINGVRVILEP